MSNWPDRPTPARYCFSLLRAAWINRQNFLLKSLQRNFWAGCYAITLKSFLQGRSPKKIFVIPSMRYG